MEGIISQEVAGMDGSEAMTIPMPRAKDDTGEEACMETVSLESVFLPSGES
jgi:hypothetical protein